jgi:2-polyprenyl-6-hydroxyphenyl methylase/3-demethylubiquinone-9 3-methyltransferase
METSPGEADVYFDRMYDKWDGLWERFGERPRLQGLHILDFGCGLGAFAVRAAQEGAHVVGVDADPDSIAGATEIAARRFPDLHITYRNRPLEEVNGSFDLIMSNEVLEHVIDLSQCLTALKARLGPGGRFYAAWGPLWYSPTGGHQLTVKLGRFPLPWSHLIKAMARTQSHRHGWTFNYLRPADYAAIVAASGFEVVSWRVNAGAHPAYRVLRTAAKLAPTPFTANVYAIFRRRDEADA